MKLFRHKILFAAGLILTCSVVQAQQAQTQQTNQARQGVCVYKDSHFDGPRRCFKQDVRSFGELGINDQISSFEIHGNVDVIFYEHRNFRGANRRFSTAEAVLSGGMNDNFSSMKIIKSQSAPQWGDRGNWGYKLNNNDGWNNDADGHYDGDSSDNPDNHYIDSDNYAACLYPDQNYRGQEFCFTHDDPRFEIFGFDNKADSLRIIGDIEVELFQHADYKGFSRVFRRSVPRFKQNERNQFSAIRIRKANDNYSGNQSDGQACLYEDWYFEGQPYCFTQDNPRFADFGFDNKADSIRINGDIEVILYQHENYKGYSRVFRGDVPKFQGKDHDQYSSIRIRQP